MQKGEQVAIKLDSDNKWKKKGEIVQASQSNHSYLVKTENGMYRRNRTNLIKIPEAMQMNTPIDISQDPDIIHTNFALPKPIQLQKQVQTPDPPVPDIEPVGPREDPQVLPHVVETLNPQPPIAVQNQRYTSRGRIINTPQRFKN